MKKFMITIKEALINSVFILFLFSNLSREHILSKYVGKPKHINTEIIELIVKRKVKLPKFSIGMLLVKKRVMTYVTPIPKILNKNKGNNFLKIQFQIR